MIFKENSDGFSYQVSIDESCISFVSDRCDVPLRVYTLSKGEYKYLGIAEPCGREAVLTCKSDKDIDRILVTDGRVEDKHNVICDFTVKRNEGFIERIFSSDITLRCIRQFGYFRMFTNGEKFVFAFPTGFDQHPLVHLIPYSYWHKNVSENPDGFCFVAVNREGEIAFPDENILTETGAKSIII